MVTTKMQTVIVPRGEEGVNWKFRNKTFRQKRLHGRRGFYSKDGWRATEIRVSVGDSYSEIAYCHEIGHILTAHRFKFAEFEARELLDTDIARKTNLIPAGLMRSLAVKLFRSEVIAWRVAKTFCKEKYWDDEVAISSLKTFEDTKDLPQIHWEKLKIIPLYKV
jgi:hypothetical protein